MKTRKLNKKLVLNKKTVANLNIEEMNRLFAGKNAPPEPIPETEICIPSDTCISVCDSALTGIPFCVCPTCQFNKRAFFKTKL